MTGYRKTVLTGLALVLGVVGVARLINPRSAWEVQPDGTILVRHWFAASDYTVETRGQTVTVTRHHHPSCPADDYYDLRVGDSIISQSGSLDREEVARLERMVGVDARWESRRQAGPSSCRPTY
jgi:hypothetical protein